MTCQNFRRLTKLTRQASASEGDFHDQNEASWGQGSNGGGGLQSVVWWIAWMLSPMRDFNSQPLLPWPLGKPGCPYHFTGSPGKQQRLRLDRTTFICSRFPPLGATGCQERRAPCSSDKEWKATNMSGIGRDQHNGHCNDEGAISPEEQGMSMRKRQTLCRQTCLILLVQ